MKRSVCILLLIVLLLTMLCSCQPKNPLGDDGLPLNGPEIPTYVPVTISRDPQLKPEQKEYFFDLAQEFWLDYLPEFKAGEQMEFEWMKYYVLYMRKDKLYYNDENGWPTMPIETFWEVVDTYFGFDYDIPDEDIVYKPEGMNGKPFVELISYNEVPMENGEKLVTARFVQYSYDDLGLLVDPATEAPERYNEVRNLVVSGKADQADAIKLKEVQYYTKDGLTPSRFVSSKSYYRDPEFGFGI